MEKLIKNKKGDIPSLVYIIIMLAVVAFVLIFSQTLSHRLFGSMQDALQANTETQNSSAVTQLSKIQGVNDTAWDYGYLAIYVGSILALGFTAYSTRISPIFYWVYGLLSLFIIGLMVMLSNAWQTAVSTEALADTVTRFPITNFLLGTYAPLAATVILVIFMILAFGKTPDRGVGQ